MTRHLAICLRIQAALHEAQTANALAKRLKRSQQSIHKWMAHLADMHGPCLARPTLVQWQASRTPYERVWQLSAQGYDEPRPPPRTVAEHNAKRRQRLETDPEYRAAMSAQQAKYKRRKMRDADFAERSRRTIKAWRVRQRKITVRGVKARDPLLAAMYGL